MRIERLRQDACTHYSRHDACTPSIHLCKIIVYIIQGIIIKIIKCVTISPKRWRKASSWFKRRNAWKNTVNKCNDTFIIRLLYHDKEAGITKHLCVWKICNAAIHKSAAISSLWLQIFSQHKHQLWWVFFVSWILQFSIRIFGFCSFLQNPV